MPPELVRQETAYGFADSSCLGAEWKTYGDVKEAFFVYVCVWRGGGVLVCVCLRPKSCLPTSTDKAKREAGMRYMLYSPVSLQRSPVLPP